MHTVFMHALREHSNTNQERKTVAHSETWKPLNRNSDVMFQFRFAVGNIPPNGHSYSSFWISTLKLNYEWHIIFLTSGLIKLCFLNYGNILICNLYLFPCMRILQWKGIFDCKTHCDYYFLRTHVYITLTLYFHVSPIVNCIPATAWYIETFDTILL